MLLPSKPYKAFEKEAVAQIEALYGNIEPLEGVYNLKCTFFKEKDYRSDLAGYIQAIQDALVKAGLLKDDNHKIIQSLDGCRVDLDRKNPRIEVEITEVKSEHDSKPVKEG